MKRATSALVLALGGCALIATTALAALGGRTHAHPAAPVAVPPLLSAAQLRAVAGGFAPALADLYWIRAIGTAGANTETPEGTLRLYRLLDRVTLLDPDFLPPYQYGALLLSIRGGRPDLGDRILNRARARFPDNWEYPFYLGFNRFLYDLDFPAAADYFDQAVAVGGAPEYLGALARRFRDQRSNRAMAIDLLRRIHQVSEDPAIKRRLMERLVELEAMG
ncbi:MAG: hypothetical protein HZA24_08625 [Nitrospirae bacterium]|nr:hypothetical protein [Nitrospirota bacterium]